MRSLAWLRTFRAQVEIASQKICNSDGRSYCAQQMKLKLITLSSISALSLGGFAFAQGPRSDNPDQRVGQGRGNRHGVLERTTEGLNLTPEQKAKVQPIIDQTDPQIQTIRREAQEKIKTLVDNAMAQIRPILTPEQQKMLDESQHQRPGARRSGLRNYRGQEEQGSQEQPNQ
jgi:Spy/CpxP family protein refolding chaperone